MPTPPSSPGASPAASPAPSPHGSPIETVRKIADLARLDLAPAEEEALARQFTSILRHFEVLSRLDVSGLEASDEGAVLGASRVIDVLREDEPRPSLPVETILANAPAHTSEFYIVPKTVGNTGAEL